LRQPGFEQDMVGLAGDRPGERLPHLGERPGKRPIRDPPALS
jgi:hypothetical protein